MKIGRRRPANGQGGWWQLYTEGFAQRCEHLILGRDSWHEAKDESAGWLEWCQNNQAHLAAEFLLTVQTGKDLRPFFGSWFDIQGHSQTGYFLGHQAILALEARGYMMKEIAVIEQPQKIFQEILRELANDKSI